MTRVEVPEAAVTIATPGFPRTLLLQRWVLGTRPRYPRPHTLAFERIRFMKTARRWAPAITSLLVGGAAGCQPSPPQPLTAVAEAPDAGAVAESDAGEARPYEAASRRTVDEIRKADCARLTRLVNSHQDRVGEATARLQKTNSTAEMDGIAGLFENQANDIGALRIRDETLRRSAKDYQAALRRWAGLFRDLAAAMNARDVARIRQASAALQTVGPEESRVIDGVNDRCQKD